MAIHLVARLKTKGDAIERIKSEALALVASSRTEAGCVSYDVHQSNSDPTVFVWFETWTSQQALDAHFELPSFKAFFAVVEQCAAEPPLIEVVSKLS